VRLAFKTLPLYEEPAASLVAAMRAEIAGLYRGLNLDDERMPKAGPAELGPPSGVFLVGFDPSGRPMCGGGVKRLSDEACEIKRMYVVPEGRGLGVGRALLEALEDAARQLGYSVARLDTGPRQPQAERMYRRAGYRPIGNFNGNPVASFFGEKALYGPGGRQDSGPLGQGGPGAAVPRISRDG
jgi:GNAT superfamily N-acetyltransferase